MKPSILSPRNRFESIRRAFEGDQFEVIAIPQGSAKGQDYVERNGKIGVVAQSRISTYGPGGAAKRAYYVEGNSQELGYLMGLMAEPEISRMAVDYTRKVIFDFFDLQFMVKADGDLVKAIEDALVEWMFSLSMCMVKDVPDQYREELLGMVAGCQAANPQTKVTFDRLWALNFGVDCILAHIYPGVLPQLVDRPIKGPARLLRVPVGCNAFALAGEAAGGTVLFGRDFMFPTADTFEYVSCLVVLRPDDLPGRGEGRLLVSQTAPGIIGAVTGVNDAGVAIGIDMIQTMLCDPEEPGFNSLVLNRDVLQYSPDCAGAVERIRSAKRGVSWLYPMADASGRSCVVEAGRHLADGVPFPYHQYVNAGYKHAIPDLDWIQSMQQKYGTPPPQNGMVVRWNDYVYPREYIDTWNQALLKAYNGNLVARLIDFAEHFLNTWRCLFAGKFGSLLDFLAALFRPLYRILKYRDGAFDERGCIVGELGNDDCPGPFYFSPKREGRTDLLLVTNFTISPEMRLCMMSDWIDLMSGANQNDFQWRYDTLNRLLLDAIDEGEGKLDWAHAWKLANFLSPDPAGYNLGYYPVAAGQDWRCHKVGGSVSLFDLKARRIQSLFGFYGDQPVSLNLEAYRT